MMMKRMTLGVALLLGVAACPSASESDTTAEAPGSGSAKSSAATSANPAPSATSSGAASSAPSEVAIVPLAKAELDGKEAAATHKGKALGVEGAKATFTVLDDWSHGTADVRTAIAKDEKARFAATGYADGSSTTDKADAAAKELKLTGCRWAADEDITLGKDKLPTKVADGACKRDQTTVRAIRAVVTDVDANIVAIGAWDDGADTGSVLETFRSLAKASGSVAACCDAIASNMISAPPEQKLGYGAALALCRSAMASPEGREVLGQVRGKLGSLPIPAACQ